MVGMRKDPKFGGGVGGTCEVSKNQTQHSPSDFGSSNVASFGSSDVASFGSSDVASFGSSDVASFGSSDVASFGSSDVASFGSSDVANFGSSYVTWFSKVGSRIEHNLKSGKIRGDHLGANEGNSSTFMIKEEGETNSLVMGKIYKKPKRHHQNPYSEASYPYRTSYPYSVFQYHAPSQFPKHRPNTNQTHVPQ
ncbi:hypothetical protein Lal_00024203 [Lupinus albus]|nr:hypothetical protein Lal_00024203 [Lupinus albus]